MMPQTPPTLWMLADSQARSDGERVWRSWLLSLGRKVRGFVITRASLWRVGPLGLEANSKHESEGERKPRLFF